MIKLQSLHLIPIVAKSIGLAMATFVFIIFLLNVKFNKYSYLKYSLIMSLLLFVFFIPINLGLSVFLYFIFNIIAVHKAYNLEYKKITLAVILSYCCYQLILNLISIALNDVNILKTCVTEPFYNIITFSIVLPLAVILFSYLIKTKIINNSFVTNINILNKGIYNFILAFLTVSLLILFYFNPYIGLSLNKDYLVSNSTEITIINIFILFALILLYLYSNNYVKNYYIEVKNKALIESYDQIKDLNKELRAKRHDFLNHLQVISGLLQLKKHHECFNYITGISSNNYKDENIRTGLISVNALLNSKQLIAKNRNVRMEFEVSSQLDSPTFTLKDWEITNILGNLIDNALFEECKVSTLDKYIKVRIQESNEYYSFSVYNKNSYISSDKKRKIFDSGFSTKGKDGNGMGLYIIKSLVNKHNGYLDLDSNISIGTRFELYFPKTNHSNTDSTRTSYPPQESLGTQTT